MFYDLGSWDLVSGSWALCKVNMLVAQLFLTLCNPMDCSPPGSSAHGILQARILEWVAISFSRGIFPTQVSCVADGFFII